MKSEKQCLTAVNKATSALRILKLSFQHLDKKNFVLLYKTYVRVQLDYCIQAWYYIKDIKHLETTKLVPGNKSYSVRLKCLNLYSLEQRRIRGDLIETYKLISKKNIELFSEARDNNTRGHSLKLYKQRSRLELRKHFFSQTQRVVNHWNEVSELVVSAPSTNIFKNCLDCYWHYMSFKA